MYNWHDGRYERALLPAPGGRVSWRASSGPERMVEIRVNSLPRLAIRACCGPGRSGSAPPCGSEPSCSRSARPGAARRPGRRPRRLVGEGLPPRGGPGGPGDRRRLRAEDRQARYSSPSTRTWRAPRQDLGGGRGRAPARLRLRHRHRRIDFARWAYEGRLVDLSDALGPLAAQFDKDALDRRHHARRDHRPARPLRAADGADTNHVHVWKSLLERAGLTLADVPKEWEPFWSFWCDKVQPAVRKATGRDDI